MAEEQVAPRTCDGLQLMHSDERLEMEVSLLDQFVEERKGEERREELLHVTGLAGDPGGGNSRRVAIKKENMPPK